MKENESNRKKVDEAIIRLSNWNKAESEAQKVFNKNLMAKCKDMESD